MRAQSRASDDRRDPHPLGSRLIATLPQEARTVRVGSGIVLALCALLIGAGWYAHPDPAGIGTHTQFGLPACSWPVNWGIPCPTCGMTTAFAYTVRGRWIAAVRCQPFGWLVGVAAIVGAALGAYGLTTGRTWRVNWYRVRPVWVVSAAVALALASWGCKILAMRGEFG